MVARYEIVQSLKRLEASFNSSRSPVDQRYLSKVALIELCGWIEEEVDKLMLKYGQKCLRRTDFDDEFKTVVKKVYGFDYEKHFRMMLIHMVGMHGTHCIEDRVGDARRIRLKSTLGDLKTRRDSLAHTQLQGQTAHLMGFSVLLNNQSFLFATLCEYEKALQEYLT